MNSLYPDFPFSPLASGRPRAKENITIKIYTFLFLIIISLAACSFVRLKNIASKAGGAGFTCDQLYISKIPDNLINWSTFLLIKEEGFTR